MDTPRNATETALPSGRARQFIGGAGTANDLSNGGHPAGEFAVAADSADKGYGPQTMTSARMRSPTPDRRIRFLIATRKSLGALLTLNFAVCWAAPVVIQGQLFHMGLHRIVRPVFSLLDRSAALRRFAARYVYRRAVHVDYFATAIFLTVGAAISLGTVFGWQIWFGSLPWWLVAIYYFAWVGFGGRGMGAAYTFAHREGHVAAGRMYRPWIGRHIGNIFENRIGVWYGIVPHIFSTSHILLHHRLNGGKADPVYVWDLDRTKFSDLLLYQWRLFVYMAGFSSLWEFRRQRGMRPAIERAYATLRRGMLIYWVYMPAAIVALLLATGSSMSSTLVFLFLIYFQPLFAMSSFLALINLAQHAFLESDETGKLIEYVAAVTILEGHDDSFGEDDHLAHHYFPAVTHDKLAALQSSQEREWARWHGAVFKGTSIVEIAILLQLGRIDRLIDQHYVDFSGALDRDELIALFTRRAQRKEMSYEDYEFRYLPKLREKVRDLVKQGIFENENRAYIFQAHHNLDSDFNVVHN